MRLWFPVFLICVVLLPITSHAQDEEPPQYELIEVIELESLRGPRTVSAFLSPDGSQYAHFDETTICFFSLPDNVEQSCYELDENLTPNLQTVQWSPDGRYIAFVDHYSLLYFLDADVQVMDVSTGELRNLTDDGYMGDMFDNGDLPDAITTDLAIAWSNDNRLAILTYLLEPGAILSEESQILIANPDSGEVELLRDWEVPEFQPYWFRSIAWCGETIAVGRVRTRPDRAADGIDLFNAETGERDRRILVSQDLGRVYTLQFSADDRYLWAHNPEIYSQNSREFGPTELDGVRYIDMPDGDDQTMNPDLFIRIAGFAPEGHAIAYIVYTPPDHDGDGLYIAPAPGEPAELILPMDKLDGVYPFVPIAWASNNTLLLRNNETHNAILVVLEEVK